MSNPTPNRTVAEAMAIAVERTDPTWQHFISRGPGGNATACAVMAMTIGALDLDVEGVDLQFAHSCEFLQLARGLYPELDAIRVDCPMCETGTVKGPAHGTLYEVMIHLHDVHKISRVQNAAFAEQVIEAHRSSNRNTEIELTVPRHFNGPAVEMERPMVLEFVRNDAVEA